MANNLKTSFLLYLFATVFLVGCESTYYAAMEKVGQHKRDILIDRVEKANDSQQEAQQEFQDALSHLSSLINFDGKELGKQYEISKDHFEASKEAAEQVNDRIDAIENVADALFEEWQDEIDLYANQSLKRQSEQKLRETQSKYRTLIRAMHRAEKRMAPVLSALQDNVLFLKHNLNAKAIGALQGEFNNIKQDVQRLIDDMNSAIKQSTLFIEQIKE